MREPPHEFRATVKTLILCAVMIALMVAPFALFLHTGNGWAFGLYLLLPFFAILLSAMEEDVCC